MGCLSLDLLTKLSQTIKQISEMLITRGDKNIKCKRLQWPRCKATMHTPLNQGQQWCNTLWWSKKNKQTNKKAFTLTHSARSFITSRCTTAHQFHSLAIQYYIHIKSSWIINDALKLKAWGQLLIKPLTCVIWPIDYHMICTDCLTLRAALATRLCIGACLPMRKCVDPLMRW